MPDARQIFKNTAALAAAMLIERASSVFLTLVVSRTLYATGLGIYSAALAIFAVLAVAVEIGSTSFLMREIAQDRSRTNHYLVHLATLAVIFGIAVMGLFSVLLPLMGYSSELTRSLSVIVLALIPATLNTMQEAVFIAHQRVHFQTYTTGVAALLNTGLSLYLLARGHGIISLIFSFVATKYLVTICYLYFINRYIVRLRWQFQWSAALDLLRRIKAYAASSMLGGLFARPEIILLSYLRGDTHTGYYSAALKLVDLCYLLPDTFMTNVFPALSKSYHLADRQSKNLQDKSLKYLLALSLPIAAIMTVAADPIIRLLYGPNFAPSVLALQILAWNLPLYCLNGLLWRILVARGEQTSNVRVQVITACTRLASGYALISGFGHLGAALTTLANLLLHNRLLAIYIRRDGSRLHTVLLGWRFAVIALVLASIVYGLLGHVELWIMVPIAVLAYAALALLFRAFSNEDFALFQRLLPSRVARREL
jgi:O-antigen/teichoic acid export membrane protein